MLGCREEDDLMFPMEATEDEEAPRRSETYRSPGWDCCQEADDGAGQASVGWNYLAITLLRKHGLGILDFE